MKDEEDTQEYDEEYEEEMSTPLYLVSSIFFLIGCLFYTMSAILWCVRDALLYGTNTVNRSFLSYPFNLFCSYLSMISMSFSFLLLLCFLLLFLSFCAPLFPSSSSGYFCSIAGNDFGLFLASYYFFPGTGTDIRSQQPSKILLSPV